MFILVSVKESSQKLIIPLNWIQGLTSEKFSNLLNSGAKLHQKQLYKIYYSPNHNDDPTFDLDIKDVCDPSRSGCYLATIVRGFGKFIIISIFCSLILTKKMFQLDTIDKAKEHMRRFYADQQIEEIDVADLSETDIENIEEALNVSSDEGWADPDMDVPMPKKPTRP